VAEPNTRDAKLIQYLNEAYGHERQLETTLQAHIAMTTRPPYKKRLQQHLKETKSHAREVQRRIKQLGGKAETVALPGPAAVSDAAQKVQGAANKAAALAQGPLHALRGTGDEEKLLKNAKTEYSNEAEEIATYTAIGTLSDAVGDKQTAKLARAILREEERMAGFLAKLIPTLTKAVAQAEIPAVERKGAARKSASAPKRSSTRSSSVVAAAKPAARKSSAVRRSASKPPAGASRRAASGNSSSKPKAGSVRGASASPANRAKPAATGTKPAAKRAKPAPPRPARSPRAGARSSSARAR